MKTLRSSIAALGRGKLTAARVDAIIKTMSDRGVLKIEGNKVIYPAQDVS